MELLGIALSVPAAFVAATVYSCFIQWLTARLPWLTKLALILSILVLIGLVLEWCILITVGAVGGRELIGHAFYPLHLAVFFLSVPALANIIMLRRAGGGIGRSLLAGVLCAVLALPVVLTQYAVSEALYGIDGFGGPDAAK